MYVFLKCELLGTHLAPCIDTHVYISHSIKVNTVGFKVKHTNILMTTPTNHVILG